MFNRNRNCCHRIFVQKTVSWGTITEDLLNQRVILQLTGFSFPGLVDYLFAKYQFHRKGLTISQIIAILFWSCLYSIRFHILLPMIFAGRTIGFESSPETRITQISVFLCISVGNQFVLLIPQLRKLCQDLGNFCTQTHRLSAFDQRSWICRKERRGFANKEIPYCLLLFVKSYWQTDNICTNKGIKEI